MNGTDPLEGLRRSVGHVEKITIELDGNSTELN